jgi:hypothetical protein
MAANKRPTLADVGIDKLFHPPETPLARETSSPQSMTAPEFHPDPSAPTSWDATHHRRTFYCPDALWVQLQQYCQQKGLSQSAAMTQALEAWLRQSQ